MDETVVPSKSWQYGQSRFSVADFAILHDATWFINLTRDLGGANFPNMWRYLNAKVGATGLSILIWTYVRSSHLGMKVSRGVIVPSPMSLIALKVTGFLLRVL